ASDVYKRQPLWACFPASTGRPASAAPAARSGPLRGLCGRRNARFLLPFAVRAGVLGLAGAAICLQLFAVPPAAASAARANPSDPMAAMAAVAPPAGDAGPTALPPRWGYLDNGTGYLLIESHAAPLVGISIVIRSGSARETMATNGASHFLEHLLFNGTETRSQEQLYDAVDALGGYSNATTARTHVVFMMVVPAENARAGLEIERDMLFHSTLPPEKLEKERGIILEELARDQDRGDFEQERMLDLAVFGPQGAGLPVLGSRSSIESMTREEILEFYRSFYVPQNMTVVAIGDFDPGGMGRHLRETFGAEPPGQEPPPPAPAEIVSYGQELAFPGSDPSGLLVEWTWPGPDPAGADFLASECAVDLLAGEDTACLLYTSDA
ncbi:MAG: insulinase family protein, partial [Candidatus Eisenbacteria bacterium]|nr:insulinase family protein [Candidatus Eisenbacteria bacterium]